MKAKKLDGVEVWKEFEDVATRLELNVIERAVYSYLLLHTRLEGKLRLHFSLPGLARNVRISRGPVRDALHRLAGHGALRFIERSYSGHLVEMRLPAEVPAARRKTDRKTQTSGQSKLPAEPNLEELDFLRTRKLRQAIHAREGGRCFYCRRRIPRRSHCLDHVVPRAKAGKIPTATWFPAARHATGKKRIAQPQVSCARCTARGGCRARNSAYACGPSRRSRQASSARRFSTERTQEARVAQGIKGLGKALRALGPRPRVCIDRLFCSAAILAAV
jgi:hypothetical protein